MSLTPKNIDHRNPEFVRLMDQRSKDQQIERLHMELASAEGDLLASEKAMKSFEIQFRNLQAGFSILTIALLIIIAVQSTIIVELLSK